MTPAGATARDSLADCARQVAADPDPLAARLGGRREFRLVGLQDMRGGWHALLGALAASPAVDRVVVYSAVELDLGAAGGGSRTAAGAADDGE